MQRYYTAEAATASYSIHTKELYDIKNVYG